MTSEKGDDVAMAADVTFFCLIYNNPMSSRDRILERIKAARIAKNQQVSLCDKPIDSGLKIAEGDWADVFKANLELVQGECFLLQTKEECLSSIGNYIDEFGDRTQVQLSPTLQSSSFSTLQSADISDLSKIDVGISTCEMLIVQTGSALVTSKEGRCIIGLSPIHIIVAKHSQLRRSLDEGVKEFSQRYSEDFPSQVTLITGPSRTADIEKTLILGAHGPKKLLVFIYQDE